jgi:hypothetical protein
MGTKKYPNEVSCLSGSHNVAQYGVDKKSCLCISGLHTYDLPEQCALRSIHFTLTLTNNILSFTGDNL